MNFRSFIIISLFLYSFFESIAQEKKYIVRTIAFYNFEKFI